jgi:glycosyltransferase involved in cell wall biosynthesis
MNKRLLVFDCHEAWVYQLRALDCPLDIVIGLRGRSHDGWDENMRPLPPNGRLVRLDEVLKRKESYDCIVGHNLTDLLDVKSVPGPRILVIHEALDGVAHEHKLAVPKEEFLGTFAKFVNLTGTHVVAVSLLKGRSWGFEEEIVRLSADTMDYLPWSGTLPRGLRVANRILRRPGTLLWDFHQKAFEGLPITLVGHNPDMENVLPADNWDHLKQIFSQHRFYVHTADPRLEDGYNMATLEAMAAGLPVLGNRHPTSPVEHGVSGLLSDDPAELRAYALRLLDDHDLARRLGAAAQKAVAEQFSLARFQKCFSHSIERAQRRWLKQQNGSRHSEVSHAASLR